MKKLFNRIVSFFGKKDEEWADKKVLRLFGKQYIFWKGLYLGWDVV